MIIPVRCFTCGKVLADKWDAYVRACESAGVLTAPGATSGGGRPEGALAPDRGAGNANAGAGPGAGDADADAARPEPQKTSQGRALDQLGITNMCCRTVMLSHVDLSHVI